ncbi:MAG: folate-binding protein YgfZ [Glaciecola sp.]|jgi:folate-binding protein YgfZ
MIRLGPIQCKSTPEGAHVDSAPLEVKRPCAFPEEPCRMSRLEDLHLAENARLTTPESPLPVLVHRSVPAEYEAATTSWAVFDRSTLGSLSITGKDATSFLIRILAGPVRTLGVGQGGRNMLLTSKGKVQQLFEMAAVEGGYLCTTPPGTTAALMAGLEMYLFGEDMKLDDLGSRWAHLEVVGPQASAQLRALLDTDLPEDDYTHTQIEWQGQGITITHLPVAGSPGYRLATSPENFAALWTAIVSAGATPAGLAAFDSLRGENLWAQWGVDIDDTIYPQEANLQDAFSLTKGCYIGQEVVAKIDTYGGLNKRILLLKAPDSPVAAGTRLMRQTAGPDSEWRDLGVVTTWTYSFAADHGVVLAYVKRKHQAQGTEFRLGDGPDTATILTPEE